MLIVFSDCLFDFIWCYVIWCYVSVCLLYIMFNIYIDIMSQLLYFINILDSNYISYSFYKREKWKKNIYNNNRVYDTLNLV